MDNNRRFIKMCEMAWEDLKREIKVEDLIMVEGDAYPHRCIGIREKEKDAFGDIAKYQYIDRDLSHFKKEVRTRIYYGYVGHTFIVWTQDQLQEMVSESGARTFGLLEKLHNWWVLPKNQVGYCDSLEQLWLAYVMDGKRAKAWKDEKENWIKED